MFHHDEPFKTDEGVVIDVMRQGDEISVTFAGEDGQFTARLTPQENARLGMLLSIASMARSE